MYVRNIDHRAEPPNVNEVNFTGFIFPIPAGSDINVLTTGTTRPNKIEYDPYF